MSRTVTLSQLRTDVQTKGDFGGATVRHSPTQINRLINQSIQSFRERISDEGSQHYLRSSTGALGIGPTDPYPFYQLDLSALSPSLVRTYGIDVTIDNEVVSLEHVPFEQRSKYGSRQSGRPMAWSHFRTDQVAIMPPSSSAYAYVVWYLPVLSDLSADGDTFDGVAGWEEFIVWDVVCQLIARDQFPQAYQIAEQRRQEVWQNVVRGANKVTQAGGAHTGRDSFGAKLTHFLGSRHPTVAAAGGPVTPTQDSVTVGHLAHFAGPAVIGVPSGTTDPIQWHVASLTSYLTQFNTLRQGVVPLSDGLETSFLAADGAWRTPAGGAGGGGSPGAPTGAIQYNAGSGVFGGSSGFMFQPGTGMYMAHPLRMPSGAIRLGATGVNQVPVARISAASGMFHIGLGPNDDHTGIVLDNPSAEGLGSNLRLRAFDAHGLGQPREFIGIDRGLGAATGTLDVYFGHPTETNSNVIRGREIVRVETSFSGMIDSRINNKLGFRVSASGVFAPSGAFNVGALPIRTPTAIANTFLRDDGEWREPETDPGGIDGNVQFNEGGAFGGATAVSIAVTSGGGLVFGDRDVVNAAGVAGNIRIASGYSVQARTASGGRAILESWTPSSRLLTYGSNGAGVLVRDAISQMQSELATGGSVHWRFGGATAMRLRYTPTGLDLIDQHLATRSIHVFSGIPNTELSPMASGTFKGQLGADGTPRDIPLQSLTTALYLFDSSNRGVVPGSGGGTSNYLRADGTWNEPPGGSATQPSGIASSVQFRGAAGFEGATGIEVVGSGAAFAFGPAPASTGARGGLRFSEFQTIHSRNEADDGDMRVLEMADSLSIGDGNATGHAAIYYDVKSDGAHVFRRGYENKFIVQASGIDLLGGVLQGAAAIGPLASGIGNSNLAPMGSGMVKGNLTGTGAPSDISIPTLHAFAPTFTSVRPGTVPASDGLATSYLAGNGTWTAPSGAHQFPPAAGATNAQLAVMPTGTVKGNLSGNALPSDVPFATFMAFAPSFTSTRMGVVPASGGGTTNYLRADGTWNEPPGGSAASPGAAIGAVQFNNGAGAFGGASGVNIVASGQALGFGVPSFLPSSGNIRVASGGLSLVHGPGGETLRFLPTGIDATNFHIKAKSIDVLHINGLPTDANQLKRGIDIGRPGGSGIPSGLRLYAPGSVSTGANRFIIPSGYSTVTNNIILSPTGAKGGAAIRVERLDPAGALNFVTPTGTILYAMPSGKKHVADFVFTKPSGPNFEHGGQGDLF